MLDVEVTPLAAIQLEAAATWWAKNRPAAPDAIRVDFQEALALLSRQPGVGAKSSTARYPDLRRLYLSRVRYHIYYHVRLGVVGFSPFGMLVEVVVQVSERLTHALMKSVKP